MSKLRREHLEKTHHCSCCAMTSLAGQILFLWLAKDLAVQKGFQMSSRQVLLT